MLSFMKSGELKMVGMLYEYNTILRMKNANFEFNRDAFINKLYEYGGFSCTKAKMILLSCNDKVISNYAAVLEFI